MAMTRDDVIRIAREAGFTRHNPHSELMVIHSNGSWVDIEAQLTLFADLVAKAEREACAKVCEEIETDRWNLYGISKCKIERMQMIIFGK